MKDLFNNKTNNTAHIVVDCGDKELSLYYKLNDNPVQHIWQDNLQSYISLDTVPSDTRSVGEILQELNQLADLVSGTVIVEPVTHEQLNKLHAEFVDSNHTSEWQRINTLIHKIEVKIDNPLKEFNTTFQFSANPDVSVPLEEHHKHWLTTRNHHWGALLLGYSTVGKDWLDMWFDNDMSLIDIDQLNIQQFIKTETLLVFEIEDLWDKFAENNFYKWYLNLDTEQQRKIPITELNTLALGRYLLGEIIITQDMIDFHPNISDWYVPNHTCKLQWNKQVMSKVKKVKKIEFFNSDLAYYTFLKHTNHD